jgi:glyoxylase-like metal-dependent hydrolase (beta-lactamase superfamily II)
VIDLRTGNARQHRAEDFTTKITAVGPRGGSPRVLAFLDRITGGDGEFVSYLQRVLGCGLTGLTREHTLFFGYGTGANGKVSAKQQPLVIQTNLKLATPRLRQIKAGAEVAPDVTTFDTAGHTPGHMSVHISSGREEMLLTGDVVADPEIGFLHPEWAFGFDLDVPLATKARMAFLDRAAADKTLVGSYHLPFPGFGHVVREGGLAVDELTTTLNGEFP